MNDERTQVGIVGAGPAGLLLSQLLHLNGIRSVILERRDRAYVEGRIRAGVLEQGTCELLIEAGVGERLRAEGLVHDGFDIAVDGERTRVDLAGSTGGKHVTVYGQTQVVRDLVAKRLSQDARLVFEAEDVSLHGIDGAEPSIRYRHGDREHLLHCDVIAGCDGFHGVSRQTFPGDRLRVFECVYPFAWLGILAEAPPPSEELIYASHPRGFALFSMRSRDIARSYIQCVPDEDLDEWPDARVWDELRARLGRHGDAVREGRVLDKSITPMRSFVAEPMSHGRLFLAGDAAHIVPPTGAKGLNLAVGDVRYLWRALTDWYERGEERRLRDYSDTALRRIWKTQRFSWWMTSMLHNFPGDRAFEDRLQRAELDYLLSSPAAMTALAENYVGLPFED